MPLKWCGVGISVTRTWTSTYISERSRCMKNLYTVLFFLPGIGFVCRPLLQTYKALFVQIHIFDITTVWGSEVSGIYINFIPWGHTQHLSLFLFYSGNFDYLCSNTAMFSVYCTVTLLCFKFPVFLQGDLMIGDTSYNQSNPSPYWGYSGP